MTDLNTTFEAITTAQGLGYLNALKSLQALSSRKNNTWPILFLDNPKRRNIRKNRQGAIPSEWVIFYIIVDKDQKANSEEQSQLIIDACRDENNEFIQRLRDYVDSHNRKIILNIEDMVENEVKQWSANVLSGISCTMTITFVDPTFSCQ